MAKANLIIAAHYADVCDKWLEVADLHEQHGEHLHAFRCRVQAHRFHKLELAALRGEA